MAITVETIHHVGIGVTDLVRARAFYIDTLGFRPHHQVPTWLILNNASALHLVPLAAGGPPRHHPVQHVALQVPDLRSTLASLLDCGCTPFQIDFAGNTHAVTQPLDPLDFGIGTLFVRDPDGNLVEFLQLGHGLFASAMDRIH
ncbi:VOC family protein [Reyranella sp. CPCC 100927]|uniref:VOC family protein n=1 Tax=Reyranella sp. CPCC 100927 TaxID=2599616 RepID=UPI0015B588E7|nr:VOC family protein [Reyranella sp. CPCC 100927]